MYSTRSTITYDFNKTTKIDHVNSAKETRCEIKTNNNNKSKNDLFNLTTVVTDSF